MPGLDFKRATDLFMGGEQELALALGLEIGDLRRLRQRPAEASDALLRELARVLSERARGMARVAEMLAPDD